MRALALLVLGAILTHGSPEACAQETPPAAFIATGSALAVLSLDDLTIGRSYFTLDVERGYFPRRFALHPHRPLAYFAVLDGVAIFDLSSGRFTGHIELSTSSNLSKTKLRTDAEGSRLIVLNESSLFLIDTEEERVTNTSGVGPGAADFALSSDSEALWVVNQIGRLFRFSLYEGLEYIFDVPAPLDANTLALSPDGELLLITLTQRRAIDVIGRNGTYLGSIVLDGRPGGIVFAPGGLDAYVAVDAGPDSFSIDRIDLAARAVTQRWPLDFRVDDLALAPDGRLFLAPAFQNSSCTVAVFDPASGEVVGHVDLPDARHVAFGPPPPTPVATPTPTPGSAPAEACGYLSHNDSSTVSVVDLAARSVLGVIPVDRATWLVQGATPAQIMSTSSWGRALTPLDLGASAALDPLPILGGEAGRLRSVPAGSSAVTTVGAFGSECRFVVEIDLDTGRQSSLQGPLPVVHPIAVEPRGHFAYALDARGNRVEVLSWPSLEAVAEVSTVGFRPSVIAFHPTRPLAYVAGSPQVEDDPNSSWGDRPGALTVIDTETHLAVTVIPTGFTPIDAEVSPDGATLYIANANSGSVTAVDTDSGSVRATISVEGHSIALAFTPDGATALVAGQAISVVDVAMDTVVATIPIHERAQDMMIVDVPGGCAVPAQGPLPTPTPTLPAHVTCVGDCDGSGRVTVEEVVRTVLLSRSAPHENLASRICPSLPICPGTTCAAVIRSAVRNALGDCAL